MNKSPNGTALHGDEKRRTSVVRIHHLPQMKGNSSLTMWNKLRLTTGTAYSNRYTLERHWLPCVEQSSSDGVVLLSVTEADKQPRC